MIPIICRIFGHRFQTYVHEECDPSGNWFETNTIKVCRRCGFIVNLNYHSQEEEE